MANLYRILESVQLKTTSESLKMVLKKTVGELTNYFK